MSLVLLFHHLLLNMFRMLVHPSSGAFDLLWIYFMCGIGLVRCVLVLWCGILMQAEAVLFLLQAHTAPLPWERTLYWLTVGGTAVTRKQMR